MHSSKLFIFLVISLVAASTAHSSNKISYDFCELPLDSGHGLEEFSQALWNAELVQENTYLAAIDPQVRDTPLAAYPISYVRMTAERDRERCQGMLKISDRNSRLIGDLLADFMSRWLVLSVQLCDLKSVDEVDFGLCSALRRSYRNNTGTLESAMELTSVYLSSHMSSALLAVVYDDVFWNQEFPTSTHCLKRPCNRKITEERLKYLKAYKPYYDLNNRFLAKNITTVMNSLKDACFVQGHLAKVGALALERLPLELVFGRIRDETFAAAVSAVNDSNINNHPMLTLHDGKYHAEYEIFREWEQTPQAIIAAEKQARSLIANSIIKSGLSWIGSLSWQDLYELRPSEKPDTCTIPKATLRN